MIRAKKKSNAAHSFLQMSLNLDKGFDDGVMEYTKDAYNFATKNVYSKKYWQANGIKNPSYKDYVIRNNIPQKKYLKVLNR